MKNIETSETIPLLSETNSEFFIRLCNLNNEVSQKIDHRYNEIDEQFVLSSLPIVPPKFSDYLKRQENFENKRLVQIPSTLWACISATILCFTIGYMEFQTGKTIVNGFWVYILGSILILLASIAGIPLSYVSNKKLVKELIAKPMLVNSYPNSIHHLISVDNKLYYVKKLLNSSIWLTFGLLTGLVNSGNTAEFYSHSSLTPLEVVGRYIGLIPPALGNAFFTREMFNELTNELLTVFRSFKTRNSITPEELSHHFNDLFCNPSRSSKVIRTIILSYFNFHIYQNIAHNNFNISKQHASFNLKQFHSKGIFHLLNFNNQPTSILKKTIITFYWLISIVLGSTVGILSSWYIKDVSPHTLQKIFADFGADEDAPFVQSHYLAIAAFLCTTLMTALALRSAFLTPLFRKNGLRDTLTPKWSWALNIPAVSLAASTIPLALKSAKDANAEWLMLLIGSSILAQTILSRCGIDAILSSYLPNILDPRDVINQRLTQLFAFFQDLDIRDLSSYYFLFRIIERNQKISLSTDHAPEPAPVSSINFN